MGASGVGADWHLPKTSSISQSTPLPQRFVVGGKHIQDLQLGQVRFFKGVGYSPYFAGETPLQGASPADDGRYVRDLSLMLKMNINYLHVFPQKMPTGFFKALDDTSLVYGQDIWMEPRVQDFLDPVYQAQTLTHIKSVIDHVYQVGRPDRLVLFSIGDELLPGGIVNTDNTHAEVTQLQGKHLQLSNRTPTEIALGMLIDEAMDYELQTYGQRHLYCHTSWTHVGPLADLEGLEVPRSSVLVNDLGDLVCLNQYTYARGVSTSAPGSVTGSTYQGYLERLLSAAQQPVLITQVGLSTSPYEPKAWVPGFGGHRVEDVPARFRAIWQDIQTAKGHEGLAGLVWFEFSDEWWKSGEDPTDSTRHEESDPEEWFGLFELKDGQVPVAKGQIPATVTELFAQ